MPKQVYKIEQFHGGINSATDPRDIAPNELPDAVDIMVDQVGKIRAKGGNNAHVASAKAVVINPGYGLFAFSHDRIGGENLAGAHTGSNGEGTVMTDSNATFVVDSLIGATINNITDGSSGTITDNAATTITVGSLSGGTQNDWDTGETYTITNLPETGDDYLALADTDSGAEIFVYSKNAGAFGTSAAIDLGTTTGMKPTFYMMDGSLRVSDGNFGAANSNRWYGYIKKTHFFNTPNYSAYADAYDGWYDAPQAIASPTSGIVGETSDSLAGVAGASSSTTLLTSEGNFTNIGDDDIVGKQVVINLNEAVAVGITDHNGDDSIDTEDLSANGGTNWDTEDAWMMFPVAGTGFNVYVSLAEGTSGWDDGTYELASTFIYDGDQESLPFKLASNFVISGALDVPTFGVWATSPYTPRLAGGRIYYRKADSDDYWTLLIDMNFRDGTRTGLFDSYTSWGAPTLGDDTTITGYHWQDWDAVWQETGSHNWDAGQGVAFPGGLIGTYIQGTHEVAIPNTVNIYEVMSGISQDEYTLEAKFKTAVVANRMAYIGNIQTKDENNETIVMGDAMIKTPTNKIDMFPANRVIEVSVRDGDEIVKLEEYADRILQFKKKKMHLINVSQEIEFLEETYMHKGVAHPAAVCKTDFGVAWVNETGCYLYDGQKVTNLLEKNGLQIIKQSTWETFITDSSMIGFLPKKRQLIVVDHNSTGGDGSTYLYDLITQSWVRGAAGTFEVEYKTNLITDWNNDLIHAHTSTQGTIVKWSDASVTTTGISFKTNDIDFGQPAQRKKIYKVYVSYKGDGTAITINYSTNGDNDTYSGQFYRCNADGTTTGATASNTPLHQGSVGTDDWINAELKPTASINSIYSFQLKFDGGTTDANFEINDMSIIFRAKGIK